MLSGGTLSDGKGPGMPDEVPAHDPGPGTPRPPHGALVAEVMSVLRAAGTPLSPGQVRERLVTRQPEELSYSTVVTIVSRRSGRDARLLRDLLSDEGPGDDPDQPAGG